MGGGNGFAPVGQHVINEWFRDNSDKARHEETLAFVDPLSAALVSGAAFAAVMLGAGGAGASLNPARAVGGRLAHAVLPVPGRGKGSLSGLGAAVIGPCVGAFVAAAAWRALVG